MGKREVGMKKSVRDVWLLEGAIIFTDAVKFNKGSIPSDELKNYIPARITIQKRKLRNRR